MIRGSGSQGPKRPVQLAYEQGSGVYHSRDKRAWHLAAADWPLGEIMHVLRLSSARRVAEPCEE